MKYFVYKTPIKKGDHPIKTLNYEPTGFMIQQFAVKYDGVTVLSERDVEREGIKQ